MAWRAYRVVFCLRAPLHIGWSKVGNLQRTRPYVIGRSLWGALTMRLTRDAANDKKPADDSKDYQQFGIQVNENLAFTYFYLATKSKNDYQIAWPWKDESLFRRRFLSSYSGTALDYPQQSAAEGTLREVEFIAPRTLDTGESVFLIGHVLESENCTLGWKDACTRLQLGGERGYGWGTLELMEISQSEHQELFSVAELTLDRDKARPTISLKSNTPILAHTLAEGILAEGTVEPLVGREWRSYNDANRYAGQHVEFNGICFAPGSIVQKDLKFQISYFGLWKAI